MRKYVILFLAAFLTLTMAACAEDSPLTDLYLAEETLLFNTANVTMTGHAEFSVDGSLFKTADLTHIQDGIASMRDWRLSAPNDFGGTVENGYTVSTIGGNIFAAESFSRGNVMCYIVEESVQRTGILRHTVASETVTGLARALFAAGPVFGACTDERTDTERVISVRVKEGETPEVMQQLLNIVLQYGIGRYTHYSSLDNAALTYSGEYFHYGTTAVGLVYCLETIRLKDLEMSARLDGQGRLISLAGDATFLLKQKGIEDTRELTLSFTQSTEAWGTSTVSEDFEQYNHWRVPEQQIANDGTWQSLPMTEEENKKALVQAAAVASAGEGLTAEETEALTVTVDKYAAVKYFVPFRSPMFCVRYYRGVDELYEVWLSENMDFGIGVSVPVLRRKAAEVILRDPPQYLGTTVTAEMLSRCTCWVTFLWDQGQWAYVFDNGASTYWIALFGTDPDLTPAATETGNG